jgi:hypothetical protein
MMQLRASAQTRAADHFYIQLDRFSISSMVQLLLVATCHSFSSRQIHLPKKKLVFYPHRSRIFSGLRQAHHICQARLED